MRAQGRRQDQWKVIRVGQKDENKCTKLVLKLNLCKEVRHPLSGRGVIR